MRVLFVSANRTEIYMRTLPLGLACVASAVERAGHEVRLLDLLGTADATEALSDAVRDWNPEAIGVSIRNIDDQNMSSAHAFTAEANGIVRQIKGLSPAPVILGGAGYSIFPESALEESSADMGIWGEGEEAFPLLLERLDGGRPVAGVPGLYVKGKGLQGKRLLVKDLDRFPLPDGSLLPLPEGSNATLPVQTRRGCPLACSYCSTESIEGKAVRRRSPKEVVAWIGTWKKEHVRQLYFVDNTFNLPATYAKELCRELAAASLGLPWRCIIYPSRLDRNLASLMSAAGCVEASIGFDSGCPAILKSMNKHFGVDEIVGTSRVLQGAGIRRMGFLLLGGPGETRNSVKESLAFADSLELDSLKVTIGVRIYPHTPLAAQARKEGAIAEDDDLLHPRFYMVPGLEDWIRETVAAYAESRPNWIVDK